MGENGIRRRHGSCIDEFLYRDVLWVKLFLAVRYESGKTARISPTDNIVLEAGSRKTEWLVFLKGVGYKFPKLRRPRFPDLADIQSTGVKAENMKKLEAVIRHYKLEDVKTKLTSIGVQGMTVSEVRGFGRQRGHKETYRGAEYTVDFMPKVKLEVIVNDNEVEGAINAICEAARTGQIGDGKIFQYNLEQVVRIRTGETGTEAI